MNTINCNLTESDYRAMRKYVMFRYRKVHWFYGLILLVLYTITWSGNKPDAPLGEKIASLFVVTVAWIVLSVVYFAVWKLITRFTGARFRGTLGLHTFEISDDAIIESNVDGKVEMRITGIRAIAETPTHFFIITKAGTTSVIPKKDLQSFEAINILKNKVANNKS